MIEAKLPPQNIDIEKAILGVCLIERNAISIATEILKPEMFYDSSNQRIFEVMCEINLKGQNLDSFTVAEVLGQKKILDDCGGSYYLTVLTNCVVSSYHLKSHAKILAEKYLKRECIKIAGDLYNRSFDDSDPFESIDGAEKELNNLVQGLQTKDVQKADSVAIEVFQEIESLRGREEFLTGVTSGYPSLDNITMGWQESDLIILAARPAVGKTAFVLRLAANPATLGTPTAFFSLEMSAKQLIKRVLSSESGIFLRDLRSAKLDDEQMSNLFTLGVRKVAGMELYIDDTASITVSQIKSKLRKLKKKGVRLAVIDYLQLIKSTAGKNANRQQQIGEISRELKILAKELDMPIIALSQLSREIEKRKSPIPVLSDLREAGDIEQDADIVMFLYGHSQEECESDKEKEKETWARIAKHRNGELGTIEFEFDKERQRFTDKGVGQIQSNWRKLNQDEITF
jgi:replicative DNA helicase